VAGGLFPFSRVDVTFLLGGILVLAGLGLLLRVATRGRRAKRAWAQRPVETTARR
jgi:hypothetical protein